MVPQSLIMFQNIECAGKHLNDSTKQLFITLTTGIPEVWLLKTLPSYLEAVNWGLLSFSSSKTMVTSAVALLVEGWFSCASTFRFWKKNHIIFNCTKFLIIFNDKMSLIVTWKLKLAVVSLSRSTGFFTRIIPSGLIEKGTESGIIRIVPTNPPWDERGHLVSSFLVF